MELVDAVRAVGEYPLTLAVAMGDIPFLGASNPSLEMVGSVGHHNLARGEVGCEVLAVVHRCIPLKVCIQQGGCTPPLCDTIIPQDERKVNELYVT